MDIQEELDDIERQVVARRLLAEQRMRFDGAKKAAYTAAGINAATWTRVTSGQRVRPNTLVQMVKRLWPESQGRWERVPDEDAPKTLSRGDLESVIATLRIVSEDPTFPVVSQLLDLVLRVAQEVEGLDEAERKRLVSGLSELSLKLRPTEAAAYKLMTAGPSEVLPPLGATHRPDDHAQTPEDHDQ